MAVKKALAAYAAAAAALALSLPASAQEKPPVCVGSSLRPIMETHKIPPYPPDAVQLSLQGKSLMRVVIGKDGKIAEIATIDTSGFDILDKAAENWIKQTWLWRPIPDECASIETRVSMVWTLTDIGRPQINSIVRITAPKSDQPGGAHPVILDVLFSDTGKIMRVRIVSSSGSVIMDDKAIEVMKLHKFTPAQVDGKPTASAFMVQVDW